MKPRLLLWLLLGLAMLAVPLSMILRKEYGLREGQTLRLRLAPVDPVDKFRGRYMDLRFEIENTPNTLPAGVKPGEHEAPLYAVLELDPAGFATLKSVQTEQPSTGLWLKVTNMRWDNRIQVPFRRYYLNENRAAEVEKKARDLMQEARKAGAPCPIFAVVRLYEGEGTLLSLNGPEGPL